MASVRYVLLVISVTVAFEGMGLAAATLPDPAAREGRLVLWSGAQAPCAEETPLLQGVRFVVVKPREPEKDGFDWLHGAAIYRHQGVLFTSWGSNRGKENTVGEVVRGRRSRDNGRTWLPVEEIGPRVEGEGRSHGVFLAQEGRLWAFHSRFGKGRGRFAGLAMEAFVLDEATDRWTSQGIVARGIWPLREPVRMADGNWFIPGCDENWLAAVAISHGDDLMKWDTIRVPVGDRVYTEANAWVDRDEITLVMRNHSPIDADFSCAAVSTSRDFGRTWASPVESNLPMTTSKPYCGYLSTGQRYLIASTVRDHRGRRDHLTIAVGRPGEKTLCRVWRIRSAVREGANGGKPQRLAYPHAIEYDGHLYVVYSAGAGGNRNDCELAVIPVEALAVNSGITQGLRYSRRLRNPLAWSLVIRRRDHHRIDRRIIQGAAEVLHGLRRAVAQLFDLFDPRGKPLAVHVAEVGNLAIRALGKPLQQGKPATADADRG